MTSSLRRYTELKPSRGTEWPSSVRAHVATHQRVCLGPLAGMPGTCVGEKELDHVRASGGMGMKSKSIAVNAARLCASHHRLKHDEGKTWRPRLLSVIGALHGDCPECQAENLAEYGVPLQDIHSAHVDPVPGCEACYQAARR